MGIIIGYRIPGWGQTGNTGSTGTKVPLIYSH